VSPALHIYSFPRNFLVACRRNNVALTRFALIATIRNQTMDLAEEIPSSSKRRDFLLRKRYRISTSKFGIGQIANSNCTPLGLHRIAEKIGGGHIIGTVFKARQPIGLTWNGMPNATIAHRIFWLDGLEAGFNRGGKWTPTPVTFTSTAWATNPPWANPPPTAASISPPMT
jgi:hypothetical protein